MLILPHFSQAGYMSSSWVSWIPHFHPDPLARGVSSEEEEEGATPTPGLPAASGSAENMVTKSASTLRQGQFSRLCPGEDAVVPRAWEDPGTCRAGSGGGPWPLPRFRRLSLQLEMPRVQGPLTLRLLLHY